ncbi:MAG: hypothetical protein F4X11_15080 [Acidobacteria bacterium]|nr:hypothetical protein [Acidobacteriota bacterium]
MRFVHIVVATIGCRKIETAMGWIEKLLACRSAAEWYEEKCNNHTMRVYYDIDKAFPIYIRGWQGKVRLDLDANIAAEYSTLIQRVAEDLDRESARINLAFRAAYLLFQGSPCKNEDDFRHTLQVVVGSHEDSLALRGAIVNLVRLARTGLEPEAFFESSEMREVERLSGDPLPELASYRIARARAEMGKSIRETKK